MVGTNTTITNTVTNNVNINIVNMNITIVVINSSILIIISSITILIIVIIIILFVAMSSPTEPSHFAAPPLNGQNSTTSHTAKPVLSIGVSKLLCSKICPSGSPCCALSHLLSWPPTCSMMPSARSTSKNSTSACFVTPLATGTSARSTFPFRTLWLVHVGLWMASNPLPSCLMFTTASPSVATPLPSVTLLPKLNSMSFHLSFVFGAMCRQTPAWTSLCAT